MPNKLPKSNLPSSFSNTPMANTFPIKPIMPPARKGGDVIWFMSKYRDRPVKHVLSFPYTEGRWVTSDKTIITVPADAATTEREAWERYAAELRAELAHVESEIDSTSPVNRLSRPAPSSIDPPRH